MKIVVERTSELDSEVAEAVTQLDESHFGKVPIVRKYKWSPTDWTLYAIKRGRMLSSAKIVDRFGRIDGRRVRIGGVNNVITLRDVRGQGLSSAVMKRVNRVIMKKLNCDYGLLLCATALMPFYSRLGWRRTTAKVYFRQPRRRVRWEAETMLLGGGTKDPELIDLCGLPW